MANVIGEVTRMGTGSLFVSGAEVVAPAKAWSAISRGVSLGFFESAGAAMKVIESAVGVKLRWAQENMRGDIEHYVGRDSELDPRDIWGESLIGWFEIDGTSGTIMIADTAAQRARLWGDRSEDRDNLVQNTVSTQPVLSQLNMNGRPNLALDQVAAQRMLAAATKTPPYAVMIAAVRSLGGGLGPGVTMHILEIGSFFIGVNAGGGWIAGNGVGTATGPGSLTTPQQVTALQEAAGAEPLTLRVDGSLADTASGVPAGGILGLSSATDPWGGRIGAIVIASATDIGRVQQTERYLRKFGTP